MRTVSTYRPARSRRFKSMLMTALLLLAAFLAGAAVQDSAGLLQEIYAVAPVAAEGVKSFLQDKLFFEVNKVTNPSRKSSLIQPVVVGSLPVTIRGP